SGRTPFPDAQSATAILAAVLTRTADPLSRHADVPLELDRIVARCLAREPQGRFGDVGELDEALAEVVSPGLARPAPAPATVRLVPAERVTTPYARQVPPEEAARPVEPARAPGRPTPVEFVGGLPVRQTPAEPAVRALRPTPAEPAARLPRLMPARPTMSDVITSAPVRPPPAEEHHVAQPPPALATSGFEQ